MKENDFIKINYVGRTANGEVFDFTQEPVTIVVGRKHVIAGLDESFLEHEVGDKYVLAIPPEKAFGKRNPKLIKIIPGKEMRKQGIDPKVGQRWSVNGVIGFVRSVTSGRVIIDFNHPLAGKKLTYEVEIIKKVTSIKEQVTELMKTLFDLKLDDYTLTTNKNQISITFKQLRPEVVIKRVKEELKKYFNQDIRVQNKKQTKK